MKCPICGSKEVEKYTWDYEYGVIPTKQGLTRFTEENEDDSFYLNSENSEVRVVICAKCGVVYKPR